MVNNSGDKRSSNDVQRVSLSIPHQQMGLLNLSAHWDSTQWPREGGLLRGWLGFFQETILHPVTPFTRLLPLVVWRGPLIIRTSSPTPRSAQIYRKLVKVSDKGPAHTGRSHLQSMGHTRQDIATNTAQHKILNSFKTWFRRERADSIAWFLSMSFADVNVITMSKGWTPLWGWLCSLSVCLSVF